MKSENSKLLLGLGLGAIVGVAVGYLMTGEHRKKLEENLHEVGHGIKDGVRSVFTKAKSKAEHAGSKFAEKTSEWSEKAGDKAEEWADEVGNKASGAADNLSQKANDIRRNMDNKAEMSDSEHAQYAENFRRDVNEMKERVKGGKADSIGNTTN